MPDYLGTHHEKGIDDRRGLYAAKSEYATLRDCDHMTIGLQGAWDMARKVCEVERLRMRPLGVTINPAERSRCPY